MKLSLGAVLVSFVLAGCASQAQKPAAAPVDMTAIDAELSHTIEPGEQVVAAKPVESITLPDSRMSLSQYEEEKQLGAKRTWGVPAKTATPEKITQPAE